MRGMRSIGGRVGKWAGPAIRASLISQSIRGLRGMRSMRGARVLCLILKYYKVCVVCEVCEECEGGLCVIV